MGEKGKMGPPGRRGAKGEKGKSLPKTEFIHEPHMEDQGESIYGENSLACQSGLSLPILSPVCALE